jgi:membrane protein involved in colicin uptake
MGAWLKKWWWAVIGLIGAVLGVFVGASFKKRPVISGVDPEKKAAEDEEVTEIRKADLERAAAQKALAEAHTAEEKKLVDAEKALAPELEADPEALNDFLKKTGKDVRGP